MDFRAGQIWKTDVENSTITIYDITQDGVNFKLENESFDHVTTWQAEVFEMFIKDHGFKLQKKRARYEIYMVEDGLEYPTKKIVKTVAEAEELCAIYRECDGNIYIYKPLEK